MCLYERRNKQVVEFVSPNPSNESSPSNIIFSEKEPMQQELNKVLSGMQNPYNGRLLPPSETVRINDEVRKRIELLKAEKIMIELDGKPFKTSKWSLKEDEEAMKVTEEEISEEIKKTDCSRNKAKFVIASRRAEQKIRDELTQETENALWSRVRSQDIEVISQYFKGEFDENYTEIAKTVIESLNMLRIAFFKEGKISDAQLRQTREILIPILLK